MIIIETGDITHCPDDVIVNAANTSLLGGGGVDGAIHDAAGPKLLQYCQKMAETEGVRCPIGDARITPAFNLPSRHIIHTVGPRHGIDVDSHRLLASAYRNSLIVAKKQGIKNIAFPAISCGVYRYPHDEATEIALRTCAESDRQDLQIRFVLFSADVFEAWQNTARTLELGSCVVVKS
ncbi:O-acetyl-ADP-ribose deacetylase [BD1-7 clade bacterium]|uniref:O-acetyl-ADP-ribose deacetylase n=1 Tax=BD1-7 clade bacterium TaxID=2029982 RepID=A0A5S9QX57_9GAMM|nr:O-acetyl-ADP-ribose deacetylase [BD1-7 clade bacterium]